MNAPVNLRIWIDADAAPREVKELVFKASKRLQLPVILVANQSIWLPPTSSLISCVTVRDGANVADKYIIDHSASGDIAITADIPLAALLVEKRVYVVDPRGQVYDDRNVAGRLAARDFFDAARGAGMEFTGPQPYSGKDRAAFASAFDRVLTRAMKAIQTQTKVSNQNGSIPSPQSEMGDESHASPNE